MPDAGAGIGIDADFPGGNVVIDGIEGDVVRARPDFRDTKGGWFHWAFRVAGAQGRHLTFQGLPIGVKGPAVSRDGRTRWQWLGFEPCDEHSFHYPFASGEREVFFAFSIPYLQADWERFLRRWKRDPRVRPAILCESRRGRKVELLTVGTPGRVPSVRVLLTSRHHCCETTATFVLEGCLDAVLAGVTPGAAWLNANAELMAIPFVDKDGVEDGDQGKNRIPHDHGRDYIETPVWPETAAIMKLVPAWADGKLAAVLDLHCPRIRGETEEHIYQVGSSTAQVWEEQQAFGQALEVVAGRSLPYARKGDIPYGQSWNVSRNFSDGIGLGTWASRLPGSRLVSSFEIPYACASGTEITPVTARAFGADMADALGRYLNDKGRSL